MEVNQPIDLTAEERDIVLTLLQRYLPNVSAWAYGSRAKLTSRPASDLDLVVFASKKQQLQVGELREAFEESDLPFRVDLFVWNEIPDAFRENILAEHVELMSGQQFAPTSPDVKNPN
ncbi:MAG: nucleotidyltransferase domain-containing protein [Gammaproteobacteria bacterium]|nr:nucleotidyltransferase domain-containing protein [Gammaproteobacteria bacterium]MCY4357469.1 nucleotidyltransferase domain-containing protein [Gammaproteobacteria bacterium]